MIHATVIGNLGRDAELKTVGAGKNVCNFSVATKKGKDGKDGPTTWVRCALWGARAAALMPYLTKGVRIAAVGSLYTREHDGKTYVELDASEIELLGGGERREQAPRAQQDDFGGGGDGIPF